jgi:hypothetical protein
MAGGKREGAGRKPLEIGQEKERVVIYLTAQEQEILEKLTEKLGEKNKSRALAKLLSLYSI